jgi:integrase/recombinase XerD
MIMIERTSTGLIKGIVRGHILDELRLFRNHRIPIWEKESAILGNIVDVGGRLHPFHALVPGFLEYERYNDKAASSVAKYADCLKWAQRYMPSIQSPIDIRLEDIMAMKEQMVKKELSLSRINHVMSALRMFLKYCSEVKYLKVIEYNQIKISRLPPKTIKTLTKEELKQFIQAIDINTGQGLRMRALMQYLATTISRPGAALKVDYKDIVWDEDGVGHVEVKGKGNKDNLLWITPVTHGWIKKYLAIRTDTNPALFVTFGDAKRLDGSYLHKLCKHYSKKAGLDFTVCPQLLRRSMATLLHEEGLDVDTIKDLMHHSRAETTTRYYIRPNKKVLKQAHKKYLSFDLGE